MLTSLVPAPRLDYKYIRDNVDTIAKNCRTRKLAIDKTHVEEVANTYKVFASTVSELNDVLSQRNDLSVAIKSANDSNRPNLLSQAAAIKLKVRALEDRRAGAEAKMIELARVLPNTTHSATPVGNETKCKIVNYINEENQYTSDEALDHVELAKKYDLIDFECAARVSGTGFYYLKNEAVLLELALTQFALQKAKEAGYSMMRCPDLVRTEFISACGFQPRDSDGQQIYQVNDSDLSLVGTAEIPLAALAVDRLFAEKELPMRKVAVGRAFRAEAGARGTDTRGLFRVHEFTKIELFSFCTGDTSANELEKILELQQSITKDLELCARVLEMPSEELGASAHRKFDIEAWIPSRNDWGEITSASNCTDYQARRLNARVKRSTVSGSETGSSIDFVHTLNGTAIAIPRLLVAGLESWTSHGRVKIPKCLHPYMAGMTEIGTRDPPL